MDTAALELFFSSQWSKTVNRLKAQLDADDCETVENFPSWVAVEEHVLQDETSMIALIRPALGHLNIFTIFFQKKLGPDLDVSFLWGSLACLLKLAADDPESLQGVPRMIKTFSHQAEAFNNYTSDSHVVGNLVKETCFDMQILFVEFFAAAIVYVHGAGDDKDFASTSVSASHQEGDSPSERIRRHYLSTHSEVERTLTRVEKLVRVNLPARIESTPRGPRMRHLMQSHSKTTRLFDRVDVFVQLDGILSSAPGRPLFYSVALHGLGGIGKSTVASRYLEQKYNENVYDVCLWARGETQLSLQQSFTDIAMRLKLPGAQPRLHEENLVLVQDWLQSTESSWLIVYDNVESADVLMQYWPEHGQGRAIITTRNRSLAFEPASEGLEITSWDGQLGSQFLLFLLRKSIGRDIEAEENSALALSERLSGHALAIQHMAALIHDGELSIQEFMNMYLKDPRHAHASNELTALWDFSFRSLDKDSFTLLGVISFLMPDSIPQQLFDHRAGRKLPAGLEFCSNELSLSAALRRLLNLALIKRDRDTRIINIHRVVQAQFKYFLSTDQRREAFYRTVGLLRDIFPGEDDSWGQLYSVWETCNTYVAHVMHIATCYTEEQKSPNSASFRATKEFSGLLADCERYLYEANMLAEGESMCETNLAGIDTMEDGPEKEDLKASAFSHLSQILESLGNAKRALEVSTAGYEIRLRENPQKFRLLCMTAQNIGFMSNTANNHQEALSWFEKGNNWWSTLQEAQPGTPEVPALMQTGHARAKVYVGDYAGAVVLLNEATPKLMAENTINWAMIGYMHFIEGVMAWRLGNFSAAEDVFIKAQNCWLKTDQTRLHPFNGGCMYRIGACCLKQGKFQAASKHIRDSLEVTRFHCRIMPVEHARNLFALSKALIQDRNEDTRKEAARLLEEAEMFLKRRNPNAVSFDDEDTYDSLIPVFWR